ncbi:hypothetical protein CFIMG_000944RA [Ceratocystis fimbriata CBS 114723]|uniref:CFEM domain-containing protein n=1 Tax=Ceratocystis fimbriata CBS 114723 TaxID=1035309 RepID=A0A2C5X7Y3_9PEZI|nr:hypothetical protein CFIMG_000944RA [Ceratocystis fimbriata CBS 114723]
MKASTIFLAAIAGVVSAQTSTSLPSCATNCVSGFTSGSTIADCSQGDVACICGNNEFLSQIACCLVDACNEQDQASTLSYASNLCAGFGVTVPDAIACNTSGSGSNSTTSGVAGPTASRTSTAVGTGSATSTSTSTSTSSQIAGAAALSGSAGVAGVAGLLAAFALF